MTTVFFTGAGISASAGIPTYREGGSSWRDPDLEKKSHANSYGNHLDELWDKHWGPVAKTMSTAEPTHAHKAIAEHGGRVVTQNIDHLHERAGSMNVHHLHGSMNVYCMRCHKNIETVMWNNDGAPECPNCGKRKTRPAVVLFGEQLNRKMFRMIEDEIRVAVDTIVVVGSSLNVHPAASLVMDQLGRKRTILINKDKVAFSNFFTETHYGNADDLIDDVLETL